LINTSGGRHKAVKNWTRPSIAEMGVPKEPWQQVHSRNQKKYNMHLVAGVGALAVSLFAVNIQVNFNPTPKYLKDVKFSTKTPKEVPSLSTAQQEEEAESPIEIVEKAVEAVEVVTEAVEEVVEVVKETLDVVKEAIEKADEVVVEVKKIEEETKEIIQESKDIVSEGTKLVEDVKEVMEEGKEIVTEVTEIVKEVVTGSGEKEEASDMNGSSMFQSVKAEEVEEPKIEPAAVLEEVNKIEDEGKETIQEQKEEVEETKIEPAAVLEEVKKIEDEGKETIQERKEEVEETKIESAAVLEEVKKIEDEGKEIIQEWKEEVEETNLVVDVKEGIEIVAEDTDIVKEAVTGSGDEEESIHEQKVEVKEAKPEVKPVADIVEQEKELASIEMIVKGEENNIEEKEAKEEIITGTEKSEATEVTQSEEIMKSDFKAENKSAEDQVENEPEKKFVEEVVVSEPKSEVTETVQEKVDEKAPLNTTQEGEASSVTSNTEPINSVGTEPDEADVKEQIKSDETS